MTSFQICATLLFISYVSAQAPPPARLTAAQVKQSAAEAAVRQNPKSVDSYNELALALVQRAQETSDAKYYDQAQDALNNSLRLAPENFISQKIQVRILLGRCEYESALALARALNKRVPDDVPVYDFVADADIALGNYPEAEDRAQWALNLRPPSATSLLAAAQLRELFGDYEGALTFLNNSLQMTSLRDARERAFILAEIGRLSLATGKLDTAEKALNGALVFLPEYHPALAGLARLRGAQRKYEEAIELWRRECQAFPNAVNYYGLARALEDAGHKEDAATAFAEFERKALSTRSSPANDNRELVFYYVDQARKPAEALRVARQEISKRHDYRTLDAYAWALYANGDYSAARTQMEAALAIGIKDSEVLYRAGTIRWQLHDPAAAADYWQQALEVNPHAEAARKALSQSGAASELPLK